MIKIERGIQRQTERWREREKQKRLTSSLMKDQESERGETELHLFNNQLNKDSCRKE